MAYSDTTHPSNIAEYKTAHEFGDGESAVEAVVNAIATVENRDAASLHPIYNVIAADALNQLFGDNRGDVEVSFTYYGYRTTVSPTEVVLEPDE